MSLINGSNFSGLTSLSSNYCFQNLFKGCYISDASDLRLPATTLTQGCYDSMFEGCTHLTKIPPLPATIMTTDCYAYMFAGCTSLSGVSYNLLPSEALADGCYASMFEDCTSLKESPLLPAEILVARCYYRMFYNCNAMDKIYCAARSWSATDCLTDWSRGVAYSGTFYESPNASMWPQGTSGIPSGWNLNTL